MDVAMDLDTAIDWDEPSFTLEEFLDNYELPQIVIVRDGYLDLEEITTISTDQVMTLHFVKHCKMLKCCREEKPAEALSIPINTEGTIHIFPDKLPKVYRSVKEIKSDKAEKRFVSLHNHAWLGLQEQDILKIEDCKKKHGKEYLRCSVVNRQELTVELPSNYEACFHSYQEPRKIAIRDVEKYCTFPCVVKIQGCSPTKANFDAEDSSEFLELSKLGRIKLLGVYDYDKIVTSIRHLEKVRILQIPISLEITVSTAKDVKQEDSIYNELCREVHNNTQFQQMDGIDYEYMKMGYGDQSKVDNIYEYIDTRYLKLPMSTSSEPTTPPPLVPKRIRTPTTPQLPLSPSASPTPHQQTEKQTHEIPEDLKTLTVEGVANCLKYLHMGEYVDTFAEELIDGAMLVELSEDMIVESLGVKNILHKKKLKKFIEGWRPK